MAFIEAVSFNQHFNQARSHLRQIQFKAQIEKRMRAVYCKVTLGGDTKSKGDTLISIASM